MQAIRSGGLHIFLINKRANHIQNCSCLRLLSFAVSTEFGSFFTAPTICATLPRIKIFGWNYIIQSKKIQISKIQFLFYHKNNLKSIISIKNLDESDKQKTLFLYYCLINLMKYRLWNKKQKRAVSNALIFTFETAVFFCSSMGNCSNQPCKSESSASATLTTRSEP